MMPEPLDIFDLTCAIFFLADISPKEHISRKFYRVLPNPESKLRHWPPGTNKAPFVPPFFLGAH